MESTGKMSTLAFAGGFCCAVFVDILGFVLPVIGTAFIGFMKFTFWLARYDMKGTAVMTGINAVLEAFPVAGLFSSTFFMIASFIKNRKNVEATEKKKKAEEKSAAEQKMKRQRFAQEQAMRQQIALREQMAEQQWFAKQEEQAMEEQMREEQFALQEQGA
ncbi:MAG: hypothetical protein WC878_00390 [Candidatus Paceibacterota bacterium]